jgi:uncharacterized cupin superfamily protein
MKPGNVAQIEHRELQSKSAEKFSLSAVLSDLAGFKDLFIHHEILPPGRRSSSPHAHSHREEMIFVLEGEPTAHSGDQAFKMKPGDFLALPPGQDHFHFIENETQHEVRLLVVASNPKDDRVIYPHTE